MLTSRLNLTLIIPLAFLLSACPLKDSMKIDLSPKGSKNEVKVKETLEVSISCNKDDLQNYLDQGWKVIKSNTSEVACSWKTTKASKDCILDQDKGCRITVPDIIGEETIYLLEKEN